MDEEQKLKYGLKKIIGKLEKFRARHTELISVYIPQDYNIGLMLNQLASEAGTARNIKSASTRKNVEAALEKMMSQLRLYKKTPKNGLAIFSGNVAEREGKQDFQVWTIEPLEPLKIKLYKCAQTFYLEPLKEQIAVKVVYGLIVMDRREADIAVLKGKAIETLASMKSMVPGKFKVGGQSAARFARVIEGMAKDFYKKIGYAANDIFSKVEVAGIIVGGPGPTKETFVDGDYLRTDIKKKIIGIKHLGYTGEFGLKELVERSEDLLIKEEIIKEKKAMGRLLGLLATKPNIVAYGEKEVREAAELKAVETLLISEEVPEKTMDELIDKVEEAGGDVVVVSKDTKDGQQLIGLGGVAAILRYAI